MITSDPRSQINLISEVLASPAYEERCDLLFDLFCESRKMDKNPDSILALQVEAIELLNHFQGKRTEFKNEKNALGVSVVNQLILIVKRLIDSVVWRVFNFDRVLVQLFSEHSKTGHLDNTVFNDFAIAQQIVKQDGSIVIVNDLTTVLRYADLTIIRNDEISVLETKYGRASQKNRRANRQRKDLDKLINFHNTGFRDRGSEHDFIFKADIPIKTYHSSVDEALNQARNHSYYKAMVSDCVAIEAIDMRSKNVSLKNEHPFDDTQHIAKFHNLQLFESTASRIAPYGIFPLTDKNSFDLTTGYMCLITTINFDYLKEKYKSVGLTLDLPEPNEQEIKTYITSPIADRKQLMHKYKFIVSDRDYYNKLTPDLFGRIGLEFMHEDTFVQSNKQLIGFSRELNIPPDDKNTRIYVGYKNEENFWI